MENIALENLKTRRSVRSYSSRPVEDEKLSAILEAATYAPTGMGNQSPVIVLVKSPDMVKKISKMNAAVMGKEVDPFYGAPAVAIVFGTQAPVPTWCVPGCVGSGTRLNGAHAVGVDSCYIYRAKEVFSSDEGLALLKEWGLDENYVGVANCILGYGEGEAPAPKPRKDGYIKVV